MGSGFWQTNPLKESAIQRWYLMVSAGLMWLALEISARSPEEEWSGRFVLSIVYLAALGLLVRLFIPRHLLVTVITRTTRTMKAAFVFNYFTILMVMQICIGTWRAQACALAGLFFSTWAAWVLCVLMWPTTLSLYALFLDSPEKPFDPRDPQGRRARFN